MQRRTQPVKSGVRRVDAATADAAAVRGHQQLLPLSADSVLLSGQGHLAPVAGRDRGVFVPDLAQHGVLRVARAGSALAAHLDEGVAALAAAAED